MISQMRVSLGRADMCVTTIERIRMSCGMSAVFWAIFQNGSGKSCICGVQFTSVSVTVTWYGDCKSYNISRDGLVFSKTNSMKNFSIILYVIFVLRLSG